MKNKLISCAIIATSFLCNQYKVIGAEKADLESLGIILSLNSCWSPKATQQQLNLLLAYTERLYPAIKIQDSQSREEYYNGIRSGASICQDPKLKAEISNVDIYGIISNYAKSEEETQKAEQEFINRERTNQKPKTQAESCADFREDMRRNLTFGARGLFYNLYNLIGELMGC